MQSPRGAVVQMSASRRRGMLSEGPLTRLRRLARRRALQPSTIGVALTARRQKQDKETVGDFWGTELFRIVHDREGSIGTDDRTPLNIKGLRADKKLRTTASWVRILPGAPISAFGINGLACRTALVRLDSCAIQCAIQPGTRFCTTELGLFAQSIRTGGVDRDSNAQRDWRRVKFMLHRRALSRQSRACAITNTGSTRYFIRLGAGTSIGTAAYSR